MAATHSARIKKELTSMCESILGGTVLQLPSMKYQIGVLIRILDGTCPPCNNPDLGTHTSQGAATLAICRACSFMGTMKQLPLLLGLPCKARWRAKEGCLTTFVADAGRHGRVTRLSANDSLPHQVLNNVSGSSLQCLRPNQGHGTGDARE